MRIRKPSQIKNIQSIKSYVNRRSGSVPDVTIATWPRTGRNAVALPKSKGPKGCWGDCQMEGMDWMVRAVGLEPTTNALKGRCSTN
jgi:hypothetical protein